MPRWNARRPAPARCAHRVGGSASKRGRYTCNYVARKFGLHSAMPMAHALRLCPDLVVVPTNMEKYRIESQRVQRIFYDYTHLVDLFPWMKPFSTSANAYFPGSATRIATEIRDRVRDEVGSPFLPASHLTSF